VKQIRKRLTYANVMSSIAVFFVLGGAAAFAATQLPKNSVGTKQLKKNSVTSAKVKNGSLLGADFKAGQLPAGPAGPAGPKGETGPQGSPGTARGYARVASDGKIDPADAKGVVKVTTAGTSLLCFELEFSPSSVIATVEGYATDQTNEKYGTVLAGTGQGFSVCPSGTDAYVATSSTSGADERLPVFVLFN